MTNDFSIEAKLKEMGYNIDMLSEGMATAFQLAVGGIAAGARAEWIRLAQQRLRTSREIYINGLRQAESFTVIASGPGGPVFQIMLVGEMPNNFEFGMDSFDMKTVRPGWLGGGKAKTAKDGSKYVIIPFRHSTSSDARMGYTGKAAAADLQTKLKQVVKQYGLDKALTSSVGEMAVRRIPGNADVHSYLQGLQKTEVATGTTRSGGIARTSQLNTFRVISDKSPASAWIHPGFEASNLLKEVSSWVDKEMGRVATKIMGGV